MHRAAQPLDILTVEDALFVETFQESGHIIFIADILQAIDLRFDAFIAPFKRIVAILVISRIFENIYAINVHLLADHAQHGVDGLLLILGIIQIFERITHNAAVGKAGAFIESIWSVERLAASYEFILIASLLS